MGSQSFVIGITFKSGIEKIYNMFYDGDYHTPLGMKEAMQKCYKQGCYDYEFYTLDNEYITIDLRDVKSINARMKE